MLVVGGGAVGACIAYELARAGVETVLLERERDLALGCSAGSAGFLTVGHSVPLATPESLRLGLRWLLDPAAPFQLRPRPAVLPWLARFVLSCRPGRAEAGVRISRALSAASLARHAALADSGLETTFEQRGILKVCETEPGLEAARAEAEAALADGVRSKALSAAELRELEPALAPRFAGGVYYPDEAHCDGAVFTRAVGEAAAASGAQLRPGVEVLRLVREDGRIERAETTAGPIRAGTVVLAAGVWSARLGRSADLFLPLEGGKGYHLELDPPEPAPRIPVLVKEARVGLTPLSGRVRFSGTLELAGLDERVDRRRLEAVLAAGLRALPQLAGRAPRQIWRGLRPCTPDGLPLIGRPAAVDNLVVATGHSHLGLVLAPVTGELVRELVLGQPPSHDLGPLSPNRFQPFL